MLRAVRRSGVRLVGGVSALPSGCGPFDTAHRDARVSGADHASPDGDRFLAQKGHGLPPGLTATGHIDAMAMYAGESVALIHDIRPAREVIDDLVTGAGNLLAAAQH
jgi:hypothetical protein